ncbi:hypothetical protein Acid345_3331 [Candidatus Koribacter versatilis Ellin345]|uniref:DinB-like domain-containing protein n=1 Tax=Koribacter versatilis (strain Ellin345) TaxID=204669 RepID=Q1ILB8_KORVE|nr:DinB family protein [Candidatus Koribacter versatilis]ABF42332.1 hypothetical protein Acid345_3331 [Candidatus Koribacter versatilis Ellin345]
MKTLSALALSFALLLGTSAAFAQDKPPAPPTSVTAALDNELSKFEKGILGLAEAMPEDKFNFKPTAGKFDTVHDFAGQIDHLGGGFFFYAAAITGTKPPEEPKDLKTKAQHIQYLKDGIAAAHKALATINEQNMYTSVPPPFGKNPTNRIALAIGMVSHPYDHYGQMVEYLRGAGITPPGSK